MKGIILVELFMDKKKSDKDINYLRVLNTLLSYMSILIQFKLVRVEVIYFFAQ